MAKDIVNGVLKPAYGRYFKSKVAVIQHFRDGKDFVLINPQSRWHMKYTSIRDCDAGDLVKIRYDRDTKACFYRVVGIDLGSRA